MPHNSSTPNDIGPGEEAEQQTTSPGRDEPVRGDDRDSPAAGEQTTSRPAGDDPEASPTGTGPSPAPEPALGTVEEAGQGETEQGKTGQGETEQGETEHEEAEQEEAEHAGEAADEPTDEVPSREELQQALAAAGQERDEYLDDLKRTQAEFANFRKRIMREGANNRQRGAEEVLAGLIDVLDDLELAVTAARTLQAPVEGADEPGQGPAVPAGENEDGSASEDHAGGAPSEPTESLRKGVEMVYGKLVDTLVSFGLEKIDEAEVPFDPERHEAVAQESDDVERDEPEVSEVLRPGYLANGRVLRPAMVRVVT